MLFPANYHLNNTSNERHPFHLPSTTPLHYVSVNLYPNQTISFQTISSTISFTKGNNFKSSRPKKKIDRATIPLSLHQLPEMGKGERKKKKKEKRRLTRQPSLDKLDERSETSCHYCRWNAVSRGYLRNRPLKHAEAAFRSFLPSP